MAIALHHIGTQAVLEREQLTLSNVQIDSWLVQREAAGESGISPATVRALLAKYTWRRPETVEVASSDVGRMYLRNDVLGRPLYFTAASSPAVVALLVSREPRVGIEILNPREADLLIPRIEDAMCTQESDVVAGLSPPARRRALFAMWMRKRALQQANAVTELTPLKSIVVGAGELPLELPPSFGWLHQWRLHNFSLRSGEIGSIAVYRHEQLLVLGAGDRRVGKKSSFTGRDRRRPT